MMGDVVRPPWEREVLVAARSKLLREAAAQGGAGGVDFLHEPVCPEGVSSEQQAEVIGPCGPRLHREFNQRRTKQFGIKSQI